MTAIRILDRARYALGDPASDSRQVVADAVEALTAAAHDAVRADVRHVLTRIPEPGADFRCNDAFVREMTRQALQRITDALLHAPLRPLQPTACSAAPFALDATRASAGDGRLHFYGYDFDVAPVQVAVVTSGGYRDVTGELTAASHYHLVLNLSKLQLSSQDVSLALTWGHLIRYSVAIVQPTTPLCASRVETIRSRRRISTATPAISGAGSVPGRDSRVWADASLDYANNGVHATVCMTADQGSDRMISSGCSLEFLYTTDPDAVIEGIFGPLRSQVASTTARGAAKRGVRASLVQRWRFAGLQPGADGRVAPSVTAELGAIRIVSTMGGACISPQAYLEARRASALSATTTRRLDPQLEHVDREVLQLRPRYTVDIR